MDVRVGLWRRLSAEELMLLNCGVGLLRVPWTAGRSNQSILKEISPGCSLEVQRLWCWEGLGAREEGDDRGWDGWMALLTRWTWVWVNSGSWWWTGRPGVLRFMGSQRVGHDRVTDLIWCWSWNSSTLATSCEELTHWKRPWCWEGLGAGGEGDNRGWDGWMASLTRWTWVWVNSDLVMDREAWRAAIQGVAKSRTRLSDWTELIVEYLGNRKQNLLYLDDWRIRKHYWSHLLVIHSYFHLYHLTDLRIGIPGLQPHRKGRQQYVRTCGLAWLLPV